MPPSCTHTLGKALPLSVPDHGQARAAGGRQRKAPSGGAAKGIDEYRYAGALVVRAKSTVPETGPQSVATVGACGCARTSAIKPATQAAKRMAASARAVSRQVL